MQSTETPPEFQFRAGALRFLSEAANQRRALDDEIGIFQADRGRAAVGEKLEAANLVHDRARCCRPEQRAELMSDNQRAGNRIEGLRAFENLHRRATAREQRSRKKSGGRSSDDCDGLFLQLGRRFGMCLWVHTSQRVHHLREERDV